MYPTNTGLSQRRKPNSLLCVGKWVVGCGLILLSGCATVDTNHEAARPWNQPTKDDLRQGWWVPFSFSDYGRREFRRPGDLYP